jgi:hypothetical protein
LLQGFTSDQNQTPSFIIGPSENIRKKFLPSPSGCPTTLDTIAGEMITKILIAIETVMNRICPQTRFQPCFAKQEEFSFVKNQSPFLP